jgi:hypothetical protein
MKPESYLFIPHNLKEPLRVDKMCGFLVLREFVGGRFLAPSWKARASGR